MIALTYSVKKAFLFTLKPLFTVHKSFKNFSYVGTCLIMSKRGMLTFTFHSTSKISVWLTEFFFFRSACGKGGGTLFFTSSPTAGCYSSGGSTIVGAFLVGAGTAGLSPLPLLKVTTAFTSSILTFGSLAEPISCIPLGFCCVCEGNFPFSGPYCWLDNLEISECILSNFLFSELSTVNTFCSSTKVPTIMLKFKIVCSTGEEGGGCCCCAEVELNCCCAPWGAYAGGFGFHNRFG